MASCSSVRPSDRDRASSAVSFVLKFRSSWKNVSVLMLPAL
jgi:hypothetical protein